MNSRRFALLAACAGVIGFSSIAPAAVIINEFLYDDGGTDDREYVELYNNGAAPVDIGGWTVGGQDVVGANTTTTIPASTSIAPGGYYVLGQTGVQNVNQVVGSVLENDSETIELRNGTANGNVLQDAVVYETNKGSTTSSSGHGVLPADVAANIGPGFFGNHQSSDVAGPGATRIGSSAVGRFADGRDTNNNGRDFGVRASTPGASNNPLGTMTAYAPPNVSGSAALSPVPNFAYSFVAPRVIDPTVVDAGTQPFNPNPISAAPGTGKAIIAWDPSGGGNGVTTFETYALGAGKSFDIKAYIDTNNIPLNTNASSVSFRGSEFTFYGIGSTDALANLTDISGAVGDGAGVLPAADNDSGFTGVFWVYEKVGESTLGGGDVSEKLYLVDANDGGDSTTGGNTPIDWQILHTVELSTTDSGWYDLSIAIDAAGVGVASFNGTPYAFTTSTELIGAFSVGYRENTQDGTDGTPAYIRPATFTMVPEPASLSLAGLAGLALARRRRRN